MFAPLLLELTRLPTLSDVLPAAGPVDGGTQLHVRGSGFSSYTRHSTLSVCQFLPNTSALLIPASDATGPEQSSDGPDGNATADGAAQGGVVAPAPVHTPATRATDGMARCTVPPAPVQRPATVAVRLSLDGLEFVPQGTVSPINPADGAPDAADAAHWQHIFAYYEHPTLVQLRPSHGPVRGSQLVTVNALGLDVYGSVQEALCMFSDPVQLPAHSCIASFFCWCPQVHDVYVRTRA